MGKRIAMAGGRLVVYGDASRVGLRIGEGMVYVAECKQCPARSGLRHLGLEGVALGLRGDRISSAMHGKDGRSDVAMLGGLRRRQRPLHGPNRLHIRAGAGEIEDVETAKAEAHRSPSADVA